jgi:hypothetical protein
MYDEWQFALPYNLGGKQSPPPQWQHAPRYLLSRTRMSISTRKLLPLNHRYQIG